MYARTFIRFLQISVGRSLRREISEAANFGGLLGLLSKGAKVLNTKWFEVEMCRVPKSKETEGP